MTRVRATWLLAVGLSSSGCVGHYAHSISASISTEGTPVTSESSGLGYVFLTVPALDASTGLRAKCMSGKLSNIETVATMRNWFVVQAYSVQAHAICNP